MCNFEGAAVGADTGQEDNVLYTTHTADLYKSNRALVMHSTRRNGMLLVEGFRHNRDPDEVWKPKTRELCGWSRQRSTLGLIPQVLSLWFWRKGILLRPGTCCPHLYCWDYMVCPTAGYFCRRWRMTLSHACAIITSPTKLCYLPVPRAHLCFKIFFASSSSNIPDGLYFVRVLFFFSSQF